MSVNIETDLKEILTQINNKLDTPQKYAVDFKLSQRKLEAKIDGLEKEIKAEIKTLELRMDNL